MSGLNMNKQSPYTLQMAAKRDIVKIVRALVREPDRERREEFGRTAAGDVEQESALVTAETR